MGRLSKIRAQKEERLQEAPYCAIFTRRQVRTEDLLQPTGKVVLSCKLFAYLFGSKPVQNVQPCHIADGAEGKRHYIANPEACRSHGRNNEIRSAEHVAATKSQKTVGYKADDKDDARVVVASQDTAAYVLQCVHNLIGATQEHERRRKCQNIRVAVVE